MENDIILDGIILYTTKDKLKWKVFNEYELVSEYMTTLPISNSKKIQIRFFCNYKNMNVSGIDISIFIKNENRISSFKYISYSDFSFNNRFKELSDLINKKLKRII